MRLLRLCNAVRDSRMLYVYVKELLYHKKSLKYQSEAVNRRSTDNTMTKRTKNTEGQTTIYKALHRKLKKQQIQILIL